MFLRSIIQKRNYSVKVIEENIKNIKSIPSYDFDRYKTILDSKINSQIINSINSMENITPQDYENILELLKSKKQSDYEAIMFGSLFGVVGIGGLAMFIMICNSSKQEYD